MRKNKKKYNVAAVILAGGRGERMGGIYKQFLKIKGRPLLFFSLDKLIKAKNIARVVVVVPRGKLRYARSVISQRYADKHINIISGGATRRASAA